MTLNLVIVENRKGALGQGSKVLYGGGAPDEYSVIIFFSKKARVTGDKLTDNLQLLTPTPQDSQDGHHYHNLALSTEVQQRTEVAAAGNRPQKVTGTQIGAPKVALTS